MKEVYRALEQSYFWGGEKGLVKVAHKVDCPASTRTTLSIAVREKKGKITEVIDPAAGLAGPWTAARMEVDFCSSNRLTSNKTDSKAATEKNKGQRCVGS